MEEIRSIEVWIDKICKSKTFTSPIDSRLLRYLVDATIHERVLKETVIAVDIFNRDPIFNPGDDSIVRSSIYNLRKKIDAYYREEGKNDSIRISIPKGSYSVAFEENISVRIADKKEKKSTNWFFLYLFSFLITTSALLVLYFSERHSLQKIKTQYESNYFWSDLIKSDKPLMIVLGNYFMMERIQSSDSSKNFIRNSNVNTPNDFLAYRDNNRELEGQLKAFGMSYFGEEIPWCLMKIFEVFRGTEKVINIKYSSELTPADLRDRDIIFIGDFSTMTILKSFLNQSHYKFKLTPSTIYYSANFTDTTEIITIANLNKTDFQNDYSIIGKLTGSHGNKVLFFLSFSPLGKTEAIYRLTDPSFVEELENINSDKPASWDILLKVSGLKTIGFYYEILRFESLESSK
ncbi:MAG TPA: hypothetical protein VMV77_21280 [Bacteroidales bacterium]|nr:hypothetical protein [Bacteroidales bacterium]